MRKNLYYSLLTELLIAFIYKTPSDSIYSIEV